VPELVDEAAQVGVSMSKERRSQSQSLLAKLLKDRNKDLEQPNKVSSFEHVCGAMMHNLSCLKPKPCGVETEAKQSTCADDSEAEVKQSTCADEWECLVCNGINNESSGVCAMCGTYFAEALMGSEDGAFQSVRPLTSCPHAYEEMVRLYRHGLCL
jgi:hypothetical protein